MQINSTALQEVKWYLRRYTMLKRAYRLFRRTPEGRLGATESPPDAADKALHDFYFKNVVLRFPQDPAPEVAIIVHSVTGAAVLYLCLTTLLQDLPGRSAITVVTEARSESVEKFFRHVYGVTRLHCDEASQTVQALNRSAGSSSSTQLVFLSGQLIVEPGSVNAGIAALNTYRASAVCGRIAVNESVLESAGRMCWSDGSLTDYGAGLRPSTPECMFVREVDSCSSSLVITPREVFEALGGFDNEFHSLQYAVDDYCCRVHEFDKAVVYEPRSFLKWVQPPSPPSEESRQRDAERFQLKHASLISAQPSRDSISILRARSRRNRRRLLMIDERLPRTSYGSGYPRAHELVQIAGRLGYDVTHYPAVFVEPSERWDTIYNEVPASVEVMALEPFGPAALEGFLRERTGYYDVVFISRPTVMRLIRAILDKSPSYFHRSRLIYDAEAVNAIRERMYAELIGQPLSEADFTKSLKEELSLARGVHAISTVSPSEAERFREFGFADVQVVSHSIVSVPGKTQFRDRSGFLFVGAIHDDFGPNADSVVWFVQEVWPRIRSRLPSVEFQVVGTNHSKRIKALTALGVRIVGHVADLKSVYDTARVFVAPTRFAAGIPLKVGEAAAHGLPVVATSLLARQLGWTDELAVAGTAKEFAAECVSVYEDESRWRHLRDRALVRVGQDYSPESVACQFGRLLASGATRSRMTEANRWEG